MKSTKVILVLLTSIVQISFGQIENQDFEKVITTIEFFGNSADTSTRIIKCDSNWNTINDVPTIVSFPIAIDTIQISTQAKIIEYTYGDQSKSFIKEINSPRETLKIGIGNNGRDTFFFSSFQLGKEGLPVKGLIVNNGDTSMYIINERLSIDEIWVIVSNIKRESEFVDFSGIIQFEDRKHFTITDFQDNRNRTKIILGNNLRPKKIIKQKWHDYFKEIFENKYIYKYESNKLVELRCVDDYGDLEMIRTIKYKKK